MARSHIVIVEDEKDISELLTLQLKKMGHEVSAFDDGTQAIDFVQSLDLTDPETRPVDLFLLDRLLPGTNGLEICKFLRMYKETKHKPILMLTALTSPDQIIEGLDAGADDYVTKPFDIEILMARVRTLLRRTEILKSQNKQEDSSIIEIETLKIDTNQCKAWASGQDLDLTLSEYKLLVAFMQQPGKVLTRNQLVEFIQDGPVHVTDRTIDTHIFGLRKKLKDDSKYIETIRGIGYRVISPGN
jgi:two-component system phosphate regulon response regulator PhoB